jgi:hypothetical protein
MTDRIEQALLDAIRRWQRNEDYLAPIANAQDPFPELERNLESARKRRFNEELVQLAIIGNIIKLQNRAPTTLRARDRKIAEFLADACEDDFGLLYHVYDLNPDQIYRKPKIDLNPMALRVSQRIRKRKASTPEEERPLKKFEWTPEALDFLEVTGTIPSPLNVPDSPRTSHHEQGHDVRSTPISDGNYDHPKGVIHPYEEWVSSPSPLYPNEEWIGIPVHPHPEAEEIDTSEHPAPDCDFETDRDFETEDEYDQGEDYDYGLDNHEY